MENSVKFPVIELTDWVFEEEEMFNEISCPDDLWGEYDLDEETIPDFASCHFVDSNGMILKNVGHEIKGKRGGGLFSAFRKSIFRVVFDIRPIGERMPLEELKEKILGKSSKIFLFTGDEKKRNEYCESITEATSYEDVIKAATLIEDEPV